MPRARSPFVAAGFGVAAVSEPLRKIPAKDVVFRNLTPEDRAWVPVGAAWKPEAVSAPVVSKFVDVLAQSVQVETEGSRPSQQSFKFISLESDACRDAWPGAPSLDRRPSKCPFFRMKLAAGGRTRNNLHGRDYRGSACRKHARVSIQRRNRRSRLQLRPSLNSVLKAARDGVLGVKK